MSPSPTRNPVGSAPTAAEIAQQLAHDTAACESLLSLMQAEREALQNRDADALGGIIENKVQHLHQLEVSAASRSLWANKAKAANPDDAWHQLLHDLSQPELNQQWERLKELMAECRTQNEINGKLLARSQTTFSRILNIMRGQADAPSLYTQKGTKSGGNSSHNFGEA